MSEEASAWEALSDYVARGTLTTLKLAGCGIHDTAPLSRLLGRPSSQLHSLDVSNNSIGRIAKGEEEVSPRRTRRTVAAAVAAARLAAAAAPSGGESSLRDLCSALATNRTLRRLGLSGNGVGDRAGGFERLMAAVRQNSVLRLLDCSYNNISASEPTVLAGEHKWFMGAGTDDDSRSELSVLLLNDNPLLPDGMRTSSLHEWLAACLPRSLIYLDVSRAQLSRPSSWRSPTAALLEVLADPSRKISFLNLASNALSDNDGALATLPETLTWLDLSACSISRVGSICAHLRSHRNLVEVNLERNNLTTELVLQVADACFERLPDSRLRRVCLNWNPASITALADTFTELIRHGIEYTAYGNRTTLPESAGANWKYRGGSEFAIPKLARVYGV